MPHGSRRRPHGYAGRFAPSPSGPLHEGSLVAAMASFLDARAHQGRWLLRIEDIDTGRSVPGADAVIMRQLRSLGMHWDGEPVRQSTRRADYRAAFDALDAQGLVYGCACTRGEILAAWQRRQESAEGPQGQGHGMPPAPDAAAQERPYPGTCRHGLPAGRQARAWRFRTPEGVEAFQDRWHGPQRQDVARETGDFILKRADGPWAYQLAVVVDDARQGITDIVRGADLLSSTGRQRILARRLDFPYPAVMHVPLVLDDAGRKLSKQNHAPPLEERSPVGTLNAAWARLGFTPLAAEDIDTFWRRAIPQWAARFGS